ncbi:RHS repeat-associated core domain-containing protein [Candidatus Amarolinea aalborgensis]|uniref:RHS repeat-associated core domain-containing protein n=1 Tax=Candidatus Amarolinea aalborgensis TaxID=2249329 RepID=UPI003BF95137
MRRRTVGGSTYTLTYDAENRLVNISGAATASFAYDADGNRIKSVLNGETITYVGSLYEKKVVGSTTTHTKYYTFGDRRIALRVAGTFSWLLSDHLGSTTVTVDGVSGVRTAELWYKPWGESRGTPFGATPTTYRFTGQREDASIGLYFYNARYYDPALGRFISADTIVPDTTATTISSLTVDFSYYDILAELNRENRNDSPCGLGVVQWFQEATPIVRVKEAENSCLSYGTQLNHFGPTDPQNSNRYSYARNNTLRYIDPTGHWTISIGLGGAIFAALGLRGGATIALDGQGNVAVLAGGGAGGYSAVGFNSLGPNLMITTAPTVDKLKGFSVQLGGQLGEVASIGAEGVLFSDGEKAYFGLNIAGGAALEGPWPGELHATFEHDWLIFGPTNLLEALKRLWEKQQP